MVKRRRIPYYPSY